MEEGEPGSSSTTGDDRFLEMGKRGAGAKEEEEFADLKEEEWDSDDFPRAEEEAIATVTSFCVSTMSCFCR